MIVPALAALALGSSLLIFLPGTFRPSEASQFKTISAEIIERCQETLATNPDILARHYLHAVTLLQDNHNKDALSEFQTASPAYQQNIEAHDKLAIGALRLSDLASTEICLQQAGEPGTIAAPGLYRLAGLNFDMAIKARQACEPMR